MPNQYTFEGSFNFHGELHKLYTTLSKPNPSKAKLNLINQLASKLGRTSYELRQYFYYSNASSVIEVTPNKPKEKEKSKCKLSLK